MSDVLTIHYFRPPHRRDVYLQEVLYEDSDVIVSLNNAATTKPSFINGQLVLEPGAPIIWFTFRGAKYDIGRFHTLDGRFTGLYSDIMLPAQFRGPREIDITDLFVDVWRPDGGAPTIEDLDELEEAVTQGWIDRATADDALAEAQRLVELYERGAWPPAIVNEWPISRVRKSL